MNQQKNDITTGQVQEQYIEGEKCLWILAKPRITMTRMEGLNVLIATSINIWQRNAKREKRRTQGNVLNVKK